MAAQYPEDEVEHEVAAHVASLENAYLISLPIAHAADDPRGACSIVVCIYRIFDYYPFRSAPATIRRTEGRGDRLEGKARSAGVGHPRACESGDRDGRQRSRVR